METKLYDSNCITLDGKLDETVWASVEEHTGFCRTALAGGAAIPVKTAFRILPCKDRIYIGVLFAKADRFGKNHNLGGNTVWQRIPDRW